MQSIIQPQLGPSGVRRGATTFKAPYHSGAKVYIYFPPACHHLPTHMRTHSKKKAQGGKKKSVQEKWYNFKFLIVLVEIRLSVANKCVYPGDYFKEGLQSEILLLICYEAIEILRSLGGQVASGGFLSAVCGGTWKEKKKKVLTRNVEFGVNRVTRLKERAPQKTWGIEVIAARPLLFWFEVDATSFSINCRQ